MVYFRQTGKSRDARSIIKELVDRIHKLEGQVNQIETLDFTQVIRSNNDRIVYVSTGTTEINSIVLDPNLKLYQMPYEPDGDKLTCWLKFLTTLGGNRYRDDSGFDNHAEVFSGSPITQSGPVSGLPSLLFDGDEDLLHVPDHQKINMLTTPQISTGFTINFNINPTRVNLDGGRSRIIACKTDDSTTARNWGWAIWIEPDSTLYFHVRVANVFKTASKDFAFPSLNNWYRVFCTFDRATLTPRIYIDGTLSTEGVSSYVGDMTLPSNSLSLFLGGNDTQGEGHFSGLISDFRYWREKILNQVEIDNIQLNDYSISTTLFVARAGVGNFIPVDDETPPPPPPPGTPPPPPPVPPPPPPTVHTLRSFTDTSFTSTSFMPV